ncbi:MAG: CarD family transcriptional regulator [Desulfitobacteriaceae bacterium]|nr:CarD family transcriptional regulator [Desulfitobacteriaceae bacterium]MDD4346575.1 CarD family transcriptional regulator [Desulfitobacteriaceae bacterium]MDD4401555.1 CarD family transcriptional regulator [Desulfitobacteriaceae bacterium]
MFKVNDYVMYNSVGVYKIIDIRKEKDFNNNETEYYILEPAFSDNLTIKTPVHNPKVLIRNVMSKDEVLALIDTIPEKETLWINDNRERNATFKAALRTLDSEKLVKLIKTIYAEKKEKMNLGKKIMKTDEAILNAAEKNLHEEFAVALNILPEEVFSFIQERIPS